ncbi:hypothetical protein 7908G4C8_22 [Haloquadratum phage sp.]|jgi:hypothetical protein|nr:hypothetical protein 7908G4C8_22 [Haloquadratum phage sp.]
MAAEELVVKALPEGFGETNDKLEKTDEKFEQVSSSMEESTGLLSSLANKFGGALSAIVAGVAIATAGLLSQVPILGEVVSGLTSVINAVAFQLDKRLRPVLGPVRDGLFELAQAIFEGNFGKAESIIKDFVDAIATIDFGAVFASITDAVDGILKKIQSAFDDKSGKGVINGIVGFFQGLTGFIANRLSGFLEDVVMELKGTRTSNVLAGFLVDSLSALSNFTASATSAIVSFLDGLNYGSIINSITNGLVNASQQLTNGIIDLVLAINWGKITSRLTDEFKSSIKGGLIDAVRNIDIEQAVSIANPLAPINSAVVEAGVDAATGGTDQGRVSSIQSGSGDILLDGRSVSKQTGRYPYNLITSRAGGSGI